MESMRSQLIRVGLVVAGGLVAIGAMLFFIGQQQRLWERKVEYRVRFLRTNGLQVGAPVALTGVTIGSVSSIDFPDNPSAQFVVVTLSVSRRAASRIKFDATASIRTLGLLGDKYIELSAGSLESPPLAPGAFLRAVDPVDYEAVLGQSGDIVSNIIEVTSIMKSVLRAIEQGEGLLGEILRNREAGSEALANFSRTMENLQRSTRALAAIAEEVEKGKGVLGSLLKDDEAPREILARLDRASRSMEEMANRLSHARGLIPQLLEDEAYGHRLAAELARAVENLADVAEKINRGEGTAGQLVNDPTLYRDARKLVSDTQGSWLFGLYRNLHRLWPFRGDAERHRPPATVSE